MPYAFYLLDTDTLIMKSLMPGGSLLAVTLILILCTGSMAFSPRPSLHSPAGDDIVTPDGVAWAPFSLLPPQLIDDLPLPLAPILEKAGPAIHSRVSSASKFLEHMPIPLTLKMPTTLIDRIAVKASPYFL